MKKGSQKLRSSLEEIFSYYNNRKFVYPDPLQFLYPYNNLPDREIVGLISSSLAYGRVRQICKSVSCILEKLPDIRNDILTLSHSDLKSIFSDFKHRFSSGDDIAMMLSGVRRILESYGSLETCFAEGLSESDENTINALTHFVEKISHAAGDRIYYLLPSPSDGSACKRLNLYLKWMIRYDNVDPGGWNSVSPALLLMPVDIHIRRICFSLGFTRRKTADLKAAIEITEAFRQIAPDDPTKYDFALTRMGMWDKLELEQFYKKLGIKNGS